MRNRGQGSIIRRPGTKNFYIRYYASDGRQIQEAVGSHVKEVAERLLQQRLGERGLGIKPAQDVKILRYEKIRDAFVEEHTDATFSSAKSNINHLDDFFAEMSVLEIDTDAIRRFIKRKREQGLSDPSIRRILVDLRAMFNQAKREGKIRHSDVPYFPMPADSKPRKGFLAPDQFVTLLKHIPKRLQPVVKFSYATGCRIGATKKITWNMVARDYSEIELPGEITKTGEPLTLPLAGPLAEVATTLKKIFRDESKPVFDVRDLRYSWYKACAASGFGVYNSKTRVYRGLQLHDFRRSAARNLIRAGVDRGTAMSITGHRTESVFERYNITDAADRKDALIRVGQYNSRQAKAANE
ncbi:MAG TPA: tyrosine-type recombinase/integrase [Candidatus Acidoferrales bacterium]